MTLKVSGSYMYIYIYIDLFIYLLTSRNSQTQQISPTDFKAKFPVLDLFVDISNSMRKQPIASNFDKRFLGEI